MSGDYLKVEFSDSDFGRPMVLALKRLWGWINENNGHCVGAFCERTVPEMFSALHRVGALETMVQRIFVLETLCTTVESATRGLYWQTVDWEEKKITQPIENERYDQYLSCTLSIHDNNEFRNKCQNGEHAWLDLATGEAEAY